MNIISNQSVLDLAIQLHGSPIAALDLAIANGFSITDELVPGVRLNPCITENENVAIRDYFSSKMIDIATAPEYENSNPEIILYQFPSNF